MKQLLSKELAPGVFLKAATDGTQVHVGFACHVEVLGKLAKDKIPGTVDNLVIDLLLGALKSSATERD